MKKQNYRIWIALMAGLLALVCLGSSILSVGAIDVEQSNSADLTKQLNFGLSQSQNSGRLSALAFFEEAFGFTPSDAEVSFWDDLSGFSFVYNDKIPIDRVSTDYDSESGCLTVLASPYSYIAENGITVTWVPATATLEDRTLAFDEDGQCSFDNLLQSADFEIVVSFAWDVTVTDEVAEALLNGAYRAGVDASVVRAAYLSEVERHDAEMSRWMAYEDYLQLERDFAQYQLDMAQYDKDLALYRQYLIDYTAYAEQHQLYLDWQQYFAYQDFILNNTQAYAEYQAYLAKLDAVKEKLAILDKLFIKERSGWTLYNSLMGNTVTQVLDRHDELIAAGCNEADIKTAKAATDRLRVLMKGYNDLRRAKYASEHDKLTALYGYYTAHYAELGREFAKLYGSLYALFQNTFVRMKADQEGKLPHFVQFIAQLYITATALDDQVKRSDSWTINKTQTLGELIDPIVWVDDIVSTPKVGDMPIEAVKKVEYVEPIEEPDGDPIYHDPKPPKVVDEPTMPKQVTDPATLPKPDYAEKPDWTPTPHGLSDTLWALAEAVGKGTLALRKVEDGGYRFTLHTSLARPVSIENKKVIVFYDADRKTVLDTQVLEYGSSFSYMGRDISAWSDAQYDYTFRAWQLADGSMPSTLVATGDLSLYATYWTTAKTYTVTWVLNGETKTEQYLYGAIPQSPFVTNREPDATHRYEFSGWSQPIAPVTEDVTYIGSVTAIPKDFTVTWIIEDRVVYESFPYGSMPHYADGLDYVSDYEYCRFQGWERMVDGESVGSLTVVTGNVTYRAVFDKRPLAVTPSGEWLSVSVSDTALTISVTHSRFDFYEAVQYAKANGLDLELRWELFSLTVKHEDLDLMSGARQLHLVYDAGDPYGVAFRVVLRNSVNAEIQNPRFSFDFSAIEDSLGRTSSGYVLENDAWRRLDVGEGVLPGVTLRVPPISAITVTVKGDGKANLSSIPLYAEAGSLIDLGVGCTYGYEVSAAKVRLSNGKILQMDGLILEMPVGAVEIELTVSKIVYRVSFVVDGVTVSVREYSLGESIIKPKNPSKASDGTYDYTFSGWSPDVLSVALGEQRNLVYEATFLATLTLSEDPYLSGNNNNLLLSRVLPIGLGILLLIVAAILLWRYYRRRGGKVLETVDEQTEQTQQEETE